MRKSTWSKRTKLSFVLVFLAMPLVIYMGMNLADRKYYVVSVLLIGLSMFPFLYRFEKRKPQARELLILSVLSAMAVISRTVFIFVPFFKPMAAVVMITGISFGPEAGFLCGVLSSFVSNFIFGQGPWTPYQMFAFGMAGFLSGLFYRAGLLKRERSALAIHGAFIIILVVGPLLDLSALFTSVSSINWKNAGLFILSGFTVNTIHALATAVFLFLLSGPIFEKLDRMKLKYGFLEERSHEI